MNLRRMKPIIPITSISLISKTVAREAYAPATVRATMMGIRTLRFICRILTMGLVTISARTSIVRAA